MPADTTEKDALQKSRSVNVEFPQEGEGNLAQDEEWCRVRIGEKSKRIRFHDYHEIYVIPGLYEHLFYEKLKCCSPEVVSRLLKDEVDLSATDFSDLKVLDLGAGNGMMGEELNALGADSVVGADIIDEAAQATERDRPGVYDDYVVDDLTEPSQTTRAKLDNEDFNCLTMVAALGFGDVPPLAFCEAFNAVETPGWVAFNIKEDFLDGSDQSGFSALIAKLIDDEVLQIKSKERYRHRFSISGSPLYYVACVGIKLRSIPAQWLEEMRHDAS